MRRITGRMCLDVRRNGIVENDEHMVHGDVDVKIYRDRGQKITCGGTTDILGREELVHRRRAKKYV